MLFARPKKMNKVALINKAKSKKNTFPNQTKAMKVEIYAKQ